MPPESGEDALIGWLRARLGPRCPIGDDTALLPETAAGAARVATVDSQIAGVHHPEDLDPALVARRLLAVNLSDLAATGADPELALLALSAPPGYDHRRFLAAFTAAADSAGVTLVGGDLATCPERSVATLTLLGRLPADRAPLARAAARPGDHLWLGGRLGASAAGRHLLARGARVTLRGAADDPPALAYALPAGFFPGLADSARRALRRHLLPIPQLALGRALGELAAGGVRAAAIDLSDGFSRDLARLCRASGVGAEIEVARLPVAAPVPVLAVWLGEDPLELALAGGEDYVLLFTLPAGTPPPGGFACIRVGRVVEGGDLVLVEREGGREPLAVSGWDHLGG